MESKTYRELMLMPETEVAAVVKTKVLPLVRDLWFADELIQKQVCDTGATADPGSVVRVHGRNLAVVESSGGMLLLEDAVGNRELVSHGSAARYDAKHNAVWNYDLKDHQRDEPFDSAGNNVMYSGQFIWTKPSPTALALREDCRAELACIASFEALGKIRAYSCLNSRAFEVHEDMCVPINEELQASLSRALQFHRWQLQVVEDSVDRQISPGRFKTLEVLGIAPGGDNQHALVQRPPWDEPRMSREEVMAHKGAMCEAISGADARKVEGAGQGHQDARDIDRAEEEARLNGLNPRSMRTAAEGWTGTLDEALANEDRFYSVDARAPLSSNSSLILAVAVVGIALYASGAITA